MALLVVTITLAGKLWCQGKPLKTDAAPRGISSYEFSWNESDARAILADWENRITVKQPQIKITEVAQEQLKWDNIFLVFYPLLFSLACGMLGNALGSAWASIGFILSWAILLAGPLDAAENYALHTMIRTGASEGMAKLAGWCAGIKFFLVYLALGYIVLVGTPIAFNYLLHLFLQ